LLTATGTAGALCYAGWAGLDRMLGPRITERRRIRRRHALPARLARPSLPAEA
jgi:hypothetical protein